MLTKTAPLGICDLCGNATPTPYTSKGKPRRYCSVDCRNTGNSREGNPERIRKQNKRIERGEWVNPASIRPPTSAEQADRARKGRLREIAEGRFRLPGQSPEAKAKNSEPHKHSGALAEAIERLKHGKMSDLTAEQADAYRAYSREMQKALRERMTEEQRETRRRQWRESKRREYQRQKATRDSNS